ncbi:rhamnogalacturonan acetylesterase [Robertkochia solimangrovi]|uniref:rhamnogalacturonan acetylesterase n=1 Tax=Robertkochia solimangrovi TaxID=2213046 RepID=UPI0013A58CCD|nr:rhamnogalacturonan acetylesterase [Robertkochia solimangrovi]
MIRTFNYNLALLFMIMLFSGCSEPVAQYKEGAMVFDFGTTAQERTKETKVHHIDTSTEYSPGKFGFDFNTGASVMLEKKGALSSDPFYFSVALPEGNYRITADIIHTDHNSPTVIKAESKRIMINETALKTGTVQSFTFTVNVHGTKINDSVIVNLKERELSALNYDEKLTLEFSKGTLLNKLVIEPAESSVTLFLAGDSTVTDQDLEPWASWGQFITSYLNPNIAVANYAASGASLSSFKARRRWAKIISTLNAGDYVMIEFGHNDEKQKGPDAGPWKNYSDLLIEFVAQVKEKGGNPILITPTQRRFFNEDGTLKDTHGEYPDAMRKVAKDAGVPLVDLTAITTVVYQAWGDDASRKAFVQYPAGTFPGQTETLEDNTHFNNFGANEIALCILNDLQEEESSLVTYYREPIKFNPESPNRFENWTLPLSLRFEQQKPEGN